jgi:DNA-binding winged helix-turn-helix (wHTH) protein
MQPFVSEARALLATRRDIALEVDVLCMELLSAGEAQDVGRIRGELSNLHRESGIERIWLRGVAAEGNSGFFLVPGTEALEEDRLGALYVACLNASRELAERLISTGHFGLLPLALGLDPGRRLFLFGRRLAVEDHGNVTVIAEPPEGSLRLLAALADGVLRSKQELLAKVWGIGVYRPDAHDPVIHTAVSRVRGQLGVRGHWIEAVQGGYRLAPGVEVQTPFEAAATPSAPPDPQSCLDAPPADDRHGLLPVSRERDVVLALLARNGPSSSTDVAAHLKVSEMTALRRLREHVEQGTVFREGKGKNTRYRLTGAAS